MPLPPRTMSIHDAPQPGETSAPEPRHVIRPRGGSWATAFRLALAPEQEEQDAREQQAIADAVEGVVP